MYSLIKMEYTNIKKNNERSRVAKATSYIIMKALDIIALVLVIIGAVNWGLIGIFGFDLVAAIFGQMSMLSRIVYTLVGISGLWTIRLIAKVSEE